MSTGLRFRSSVGAGLAVLGFAAATSAQTCGPVILAGHDADDHGFASVYAGLFNQILANVSNGGSGILAVGPDPGTKAATWITSVAALMGVPQTVTFVNDAAISRQLFDGFAIIHVPSDAPDTIGGITQIEADLLNARALDIASFVAAGGGIFGLTQGELTNSWGYIDQSFPVVHLDIPPSGTLPSGNAFDDLSATVGGLALGITNTNLDGCCFHNVFLSYPRALGVLAYANEPTDPPYHQKAVFIGGISTCLSLAVDFDWIRADADGDDVVVRWATAAESDTVGFLVYRAADAALADAAPFGDWVPARGTGSEYRVVDDGPVAAGNHYFVEEYTFSGQGDRSPAVAIGGAARGTTTGGRHRVGSMRTSISR